MRQMKDSGIEWIGEIPKGWEVRKLSTLVTMESGAPLSSDKIYEHELYPVFGGNGIRGYTDSYYIDGNFILIGRQGAQCGNVHITHGKSWVTEHALILKNIDIINNIFLYFMLSSMDLNQYSTSAAQPGLAASNIKKKYVCIPPLMEQQRIADYLDAKCAHIDQCQELTRQSMEKLHAYKLSCITEAVTKGLDPDVPLKDSGVPWIGQIPAGWSLTLIGRHVDILPGFAFPSSLFNQDKGIKLLRGINLGVNCVKWDECIYYDENITENLKIFFLKKNDIIIGMDRPIISEGLRVAIISDNDTPSLLVQRVCRLRCKNSMHQKFLFYIIFSEIFKNSIFGATTGISIPHISATQISNCKSPLPPLPEQERIAAYLDKKCARIDALLEEKQALLDKLAEYKKSLIFECVTGKREVPSCWNR